MVVVVVVVVVVVASQVGTEVREPPW